MIAVKGFFKKSSPVRARMIILLYDTQISTQIIKDKKICLEHMKNFIGIRFSSNKSYWDNYLQNSLPGGELNPGLPRDRRGYSPLYYRGSDVGTEIKSPCISFTIKNDCSKGALQKIQSY